VGFNLLITTVGFRDEDRCVAGSINVDLVVEAYRDTPHHQSQQIDVYRQGWSLWDHIDQFIGIPGLADLFDDKMKDVNRTIHIPFYQDQPAATLRIDLLERDKGLCGEDDRFARLVAVIDPSTMAWIEGRESRCTTRRADDPTPTSAARRDLNRLLHCVRAAPLGLSAFSSTCDLPRLWPISRRITST
jgi:hypothetical protein